MKYLIALLIVFFISTGNHNLFGQNSISMESSITNGKCDIGSKDDYVVSTISLMDLIPSKQSSGASTIEMVPAHQVDYKNAIDHYTYEILQDGQRIATIIGTETEGSVYENVNKICDRTPTSKLENVFNENFSSKYNFIVSKVISQKGETTYKCNFSLVEYGGNNLRLESHWNLEDYSKGAATFNFQISAHTLAHLKNTVHEFLDHFTKRIHLRDANMGMAPKIFAKTASYTNKTIKMEIANSTGENSILLRGLKKLSEGSHPTEFEKNIVLKGAQEESIEIEVEGLYDVSFKLIGSAEENPVSDEIYVADGRWSLYNPQASAVLHQFEISQDHDRDSRDGAYLVERNVRMKGRIKRDISITKDLDMYGRSMDFSMYDSFEFKGMGNVSLEVILVNKEAVTWSNQLRTSINLTEDVTQYRLTKKHFNANEDDWKSITKVVFVIKGSGVYTPLELELTELIFLEKSKIAETLKKAKAVEISPNPMTSKSNVSFESSSEIGYNFQVWTMNGKLVQSIKGQAEEGNNELLISKNSLEAGHYVCRLITKDGSVSVTRLIIL